MRCTEYISNAAINQSVRQYEAKKVTLQHTKNTISYLTSCKQVNKLYHFLHVSKYVSDHFTTVHSTQQQMPHT